MSTGEEATAHPREEGRGAPELQQKIHACCFCKLGVLAINALLFRVYMRAPDFLKLPKRRRAAESWLYDCTGAGVFVYQGLVSAAMPSGGK